MSGIASGLTTKGSSRLKKKHFKPKHQKAKLFRANEPLLSVFMWGVNHTINGLTHVNVPVMLMPDDFKAFTKIKVDNHHFNKENMPSHFKVKEYCPLVFRNLRERFGIDDCVYMYVVERHGKTLLPQYLAMYRLTVEGAETYLVVIRNIFSSHLNVHVKYDLKVGPSSSCSSSSYSPPSFARLHHCDCFVCIGRLHSCLVSVGACLLLAGAIVVV